MSLCDVRASETIASGIFDDILVGFSAGEGASPGRERGFGDVPPPETYFEPPLLPSGSSGIIAFPGDGAPEGLVEALIAHWTSSGDAALAAAAPRLRALVAALRAEGGELDGDVDIFCYTLF